MFSQISKLLFSAVLLLSLTATPALAEAKFKPLSKYATVGDVKIHYLVAGKGEPVILLHGFAQTSHMWLPLMAELSKAHTVIAPDLRGFGDSSKPETGYDKKTMAQDIHSLAKSLNIKQTTVIGHDIGLMVAYAYAAQYPTEVNKIILMDAFLPGIGDWKNVWLMRDLWHFHFYGKTPLELVHGRERIYLEHFWNDFAADPNNSVSESNRKLYAKAYAQKGAMKAGMEVFRNFEQDAKDFAEFSKTKLHIPMLVITGGKASGEFLITQAKLVDDQVEGVVIKNSGHWLIDEAPDQVIPQILSFLLGED